MSSKTKIVVLHLKELIYTGIFAALGILFIILLIIMFLPGRDDRKKDTPSESVYVPGIYSTPLMLGSQTVDVEVIVDENAITSVSLKNIDEAVATMYPLIQPSFDTIAEQIYEKQSLEGITYTDENKYTSMVLLDAIQTSLDKAEINLEIED